MTNQNYQQGLKNLAQVDGAAGQEVIDSLADIAPAVGEYIISFAFGEIYQRAELSLKEREMITITSLLSQGDTKPQLRLHIRGALNVGLTPEQIIETFIHCIPYVGFPKVLNAIQIAKEVFSINK